MDKYRRLTKPKAETTEIKENEIRITTQGKMRSIIAYATNLFQKGAKEITLKAMGLAINKTVTIAEIIKRRINGLHQNTIIDSTDIVEIWEPLEEGLEKVETTRRVSSIQIVLSTEALDVNAPGYQPPLSEDQIKVEPTAPSTRPRRGFGRGRGRYRGYNRGAQAAGNQGTQDSEHPIAEQDQQGNTEGARGRDRFANQGEGPIRGVPRGRGRGRGRGRRGGRGGRGGRGRGGRGGRGQGPELNDPVQQQETSVA